MTRADLKDLINIVEAALERIDAGYGVSLTITNSDGEHDFLPRIEYHDTNVRGYKAEERKLIWRPGTPQGCTADEMLQTAQDWWG